LNLDAMSRERIDLMCERGILALVMVIVCFGPLATGAVYSHEFLILLVLTVCVVGLWLVRLWAGNQRKLLLPPVCWPILVFAAYAIGRYFTADIEYVARWELLRVLVYVVLFFVALNNLYESRHLVWLSNAAILMALVVAFIALWQFIGRGQIIPSLGAWVESLFFDHRTWYLERVYATRASGTYVNPNHMAGLLELLLPLALSFTLVGRVKPLGRVFLGYCALVMLAGIGVSVSRGSWIAITVTLLVFFAVLAIQNAQRLPALVLMGGLVMGGTFFIARTDYFQKRIKETFDKGVEQDTRFQLWESTVQMWRDHFWWGVGPAHFDHRFREYRPEEIQKRPDRAHNEFLNLVADWGVAGSVIVFAALACAFTGVFRCWKHVRRSESALDAGQSNRFAFFFGSFFGLLAVLIHSAVDFNMQIPANAILVFVLVGLLSSQWRHATERYWVRGSVPVRIVLSVMLAGFAVYSSAQCVRLAREYRWLMLADAESWRSMEQIALYKRAYVVEPMNFETTCAIAEAYQTHSKQGGEDNAVLATNAITWFEAGMNLNPHDQRNFVGSGWCWDWLALRQDELAGLHQVAEKLFLRAEELDPKGYFTLTEIGMHFVQSGDFAAARMWFERSLRLERKQNSTAENWYNLSDRKLSESTTNQLPSIFQ
jgi:O-antigen ligase